METGPEYRQEHQLDDGTTILVRHIQPDDAPELKRGFERLSPESRFRRFLFGITALTDQQLRYLTHVDGVDHVAVVATTPPPGDAGGEPIGLGVARFVRLAEDPGVAEAAITVADEWQGKGIGRILALTLARAAQERAVKRFRGEILADNEVVKGLLEDVGAVVREEQGAVVFEVELTETPFEPGSPLDVVTRKLLRAASTVLAGLFRGMKRD
jgi:GNAT superfamily N-acetyltransferase